MDLNQLTQKVFLESNNISREDWEKAKISFEDLKSIADNHKMNSESLESAAEYLAKMLQKSPQVHSVRWRVKDPVHLMEKIIRKRVQKKLKYLSISTDNYTEIITDLVGIRVLHLFKDEWVNINKHILENWKPVEDPIAFIRYGDEGSIIDSYKNNKCKTEIHKSGYRSIHYVISTQPTNKKVLSEICFLQVIIPHYCNYFSPLPSGEF